MAFNSLKGCHSVILASGTLSPMDTFQSELGTKFEHQLEANHVIAGKEENIVLIVLFIFSEKRRQKQSIELVIY